MVIMAESTGWNITWECRQASLRKTQNQEQVNPSCSPRHDCKTSFKTQYNSERRLSAATLNRVLTASAGELADRTHSQLIYIPAWCQVTLQATLRNLRNLTRVRRALSWLGLTCASNRSFMAVIFLLCWSFFRSMACYFEKINKEFDLNLKN